MRNGDFWVVNVVFKLSLRQKIRLERGLVKNQAFVTNGVSIDFFVTFLAH